MRKLGAIAAVAMTLTLAACTSSAVPPTTTTTSTATTSIRLTGVVTGVAYACSGLPTVVTGRQKVKVSLYSGSRPVASVTIRSGAKYRFSVTPGTYRLVGWWRSKAVAVEGDHVATVNILNLCR